MPVFIMKLKCDHSAEESVEQIRNKNYTDCLKDYNGEVLLVEINYDKKSKKHICIVILLKNKKYNYSKSTIDKQQKE